MGAHPRSRGENLSAVGSGLMAMGSSPLTRGKHILPPIDQAGGRLIPAHAGKTGSHRRTGRWCRAHPRSRGENRLATGSVGRASGSSPLTRGKLFYESFTRIL